MDGVPSANNFQDPVGLSEGLLKEHGRAAGKTPMPEDDSVPRSRSREEETPVRPIHRGLSRARIPAAPTDSVLLAVLRGLVILPTPTAPVLYGALMTVLMEPRVWQCLLSGVLAPVFVLGCR